MSRKITSFDSQPIMGKIIRIEDECEDTKNFFVEMPEKIEGVKAGQFVMLWIPVVDEYPIGVAGFKDEILELGIAKMGVGTEALFNKQIGERVGIRGFYGKPFKPLENVNHLLLGGGFGMTPLKLLINTLKSRNRGDKIHVFEGARTKNKLMYLDFLQNLHDKGEIKFHVCTDDGSWGYKGFPTVALEEVLQEDSQQSVIYVAGPERMMKVVFEIGKKYQNVKDMQMSLADRYMRCGFGLCSACTVDPTGWRICVDGPVFNKEQLEQITDFGEYIRLATGEKKRI